MGLLSSELRIGNYIALKYNGNTDVIKVDSIEYETINDDILLKAIEPIPLTEEILLKCGFNGFDTTILTHDSIELIYLRKPFIQSNYYLVKSNGGNKLTSVQCLHQLQNLYFALTGEELTINL